MSQRNFVITNLPEFDNFQEMVEMVGEEFVVQAVNTFVKDRKYRKDLREKKDEQAKVAVRFTKLIQEGMSADEAARKVGLGGTRSEVKGS